ncbi:MAG: RNA polymerase sporulation sigma factor, SigF/SigG family [Lachnospiraceae bacterium]|jgi:RNA polymerase sporulation-specific sigma factor|nr:RNA polymerase sporulation sigma factor, SigF/SigG family [Lachnospiraceae bacterium]MCI9599716.1 RNA polymerase sporulation sigma factor, SigF/SigG family [Lachnospiraceae bacterium]MDE7319421.1 SigF/SigG family RNA polymerase sporulation sigma factor [Lachnospiraceae bacterium]
MEETFALIERSHHGDKEAREQLVEENMGLVWSVVKRFTGRGTDMEDLFQIGAMGLLKAIDKFDTSFEVKFSTYAVPMIAGEIKRFLRDDGIVKVSRTLKENCWKIKRETELFRQKTGREPTLEELSAVTELPREEIAMALESSAEVESIYKTIPQKDGSEVCLLDRMENQNQGNGMQQLLNRVVLEQLLLELPDTDRRLIIMRYMQDKTQSEVARVLGVSQVQVSRLEKKILKQMRERLVS